MSLSVFRTCHAWAKIAVPLVPAALNLQSGPIVRSARGKKSKDEPTILSLLAAHKKQSLKLSFSEICIFLCLLTWKLFDLPDIEPDDDDDAPSINYEA